MRDFENYECEGQMELEDYLNTLEQDEKNKGERKDVSLGASGSGEKTTLRHHADIKLNGSASITSAHFAEDA